jgi:leucyl/phenylalanyl-tRNA--protein transferase
VGEVFCGESMFALAPDASKAAFVTLVRHLEAWGCPLIDCQMHTAHLATFGAREISRDQFLLRLAQGQKTQGPLAPWRIDDALDLELGRKPSH